MAPVRENAADVHASALVVDTHVDTPQKILDAGFDLGGEPRARHQVDLDALRRGNVGAIFFAIWWNPSLAGTDPRARALALLDACRREIARHPEALTVATTSDEILAARRAERTAVLFGLEGAEPLGGDVGALRAMYALGIRYVGLTWNAHTPFADAASPSTPLHGGLSELGRAAIAEMNRLGMIVDLSHLSDEAAAQAVAASAAPVVATHSSARALAGHRRNLPDDLLRAIAAKGGVVHVNFHSAFLDDGFAARLNEREEAHGAEYEALKRPREGVDPTRRAREVLELFERLGSGLPRPPLSVLVDHVEHVARVAGADHVGIGSDFDGAIVPPEGIDSAADLPKITAALLERGWSPGDVRKVLGGNFLRVLREVERVSRETSARPP